MSSAEDIRFRTIISETEDPLLHYIFAGIPSRDRAKVIKRIARNTALSAFGLRLENLPEHIRAMYRPTPESSSFEPKISGVLPSTKKSQTKTPDVATTEIQQEDETSGMGLPAFLQGAEELGIFGCTPP